MADVQTVDDVMADAPNGGGFNPQEWFQFFGDLFQGLGEGPSFRELTPQEIELLDLQVERVKKAAQLQDDLYAAIERQYGKPYADVVASNLQFTEQWQRRAMERAEQELLRGERAAMRTESRSEELRRQYTKILGMSPEEVAAHQAAHEQEVSDTLLQAFREGYGRQREAAGMAYDRWKQAWNGEKAANPVVEREIRRQREALDNTGARLYGPAWEATEFGRRSRLDQGESEAAQRYAANQEVINQAAPYWTGFGGLNLGGAVATPMPSTSRLLVSQSGLPESALLSGVTSPLTTSAPILGYLSGQPPGAGALSQILSQNRLAENQFNQNAYNSQLQRLSTLGNLGLNLGQLGLGYDRLAYDQSRASADQDYRNSFGYGQLIGAGIQGLGQIGASYFSKAPSFNFFGGGGAAGGAGQWGYL